MMKKQRFPFLVGSKWTARQTTWGWRHFQVVNRKNQGKFVFAEMVASCDEEVRFWLNATQLKDRSLWQPGWQTLQEIKENKQDNPLEEV
ncbi:TIGR02450 family Trp-rich protein [Roseofilum casamattae]|uniref:TIGR02450 family Trp-rich protein n=1 Tax=Roseofilum casamattae BLCC-M143 TaxID=3022442 RepID=A0ABT7BUC7_9CYAN|nr:TIGR02450 family Trp-rich protein [Roseofilum casamattae]MDJ1181883.1 TIGR02450 family Trp-rich protein [Roseofilum casamattae BLCC-M143]